MPIIYEVQLSADPSIATEIASWLPEHIQEMTDLPGFMGARWLEQLDPKTDRIIHCVHYQLEDQESLDRYFEQHAPRMRAEGIDRFGDHFEATRRIFKLHQG